ncbi:hypothetical protein [Legionella sp.]|uniref:hypothetical protein n=1 Tax=Legionella sp. TaxID=459 RepID=UPI003D0FE179
MIKALIKEIKVLFHNHEQQFSVLGFVLQQNLIQNKAISENLKLFISEIINDVKHPDFKSYFEITTLSIEDLQCRIGRFFESTLAVNMLMNPSPKTWCCINKVSERIIECISLVRQQEAFEPFLADLGPDSKSGKTPNLALAFGRYSNKPTINDVIVTLKEQKDIVRIMLIQFMFMRDIYPLFEFDPQTQALIKEYGYGGELAKYIEAVGAKDIGPFFWNYPKFATYKDRGRGKFIPYTSTRLGISILPEDRDEFPRAATNWCPDCLCQEADLNSPYTRFLLQQDIPYVAGPSGMTTLLSSAMLFLGQFANEDEHNHYILAIMSFITGGGLHSIHEVLTVPCERLGLLKAYRPFGKKAGNYQDFFDLFSFDERVTKNIDDAWDSTVSWLCKHFPELTTEALYQVEPIRPAVPAAVKEKEAESKQRCSCSLL